MKEQIQVWVWALQGEVAPSVSFRKPLSLHSFLLMAHPLFLPLLSLLHLWMVSHEHVSLGPWICVYCCF